MEMNKTQLYDLMATTSEELVSQYIENQPEILKIKNNSSEKIIRDYKNLELIKPTLRNYELEQKIAEVLRALKYEDINYSILKQLPVVTDNPKSTSVPAQIKQPKLIIPKTEDVQPSQPEIPTMDEVQQTSPSVQLETIAKVESQKVPLSARLASLALGTTRFTGSYLALSEMARGLSASLGVDMPTDPKTMLAYAAGYISADKDSSLATRIVSATAATWLATQSYIAFNQPQLEYDDGRMITPIMLGTILALGYLARKTFQAIKKLSGKAENLSNI